MAYCKDCKVYYGLPVGWQIKLKNGIEPPHYKHDVIFFDYGRK